MSRARSHSVLRAPWVALAVVVAIALGAPGVRAQSDGSTASTEKKTAEVPLPPITGSIALPRPSETLAKLFTGNTPDSVDDLKAMQAHVRALSEGLVQATVGVRVGGSQGSGVIISPDGYVLTAGHVSNDAGRRATLILHDGREVRAETLGANRSIDSGLMKITEPGPFPFVTMGNSADLARGQWCLATGHPGGYEEGRSAPLRLGRVTRANSGAITTDCILVGGDSGGPLFDMYGRVIGIHSRITASAAGNVHVPVDTYRDTWKRLAGAEVWGSGIGGRGRPDPNSPFLGVRAEESVDDKMVVGQVVDDTPAAKAGLKPGDEIVRFGDDEVKDFRGLVEAIRKNEVGKPVTVRVIRDEKTLELTVVLEKRGDR